MWKICAGMDSVSGLVPDINAGGQVDKYADTGAAGKGAFEDALAAFQTELHPLHLHGQCLLFGYIFHIAITPSLCNHLHVLACTSSPCTDPCGRVASWL